MSKRDDITNDMTLPVDALGDAFDHTDVYGEIDESLHAWAEGQANGSQPSQTHMFRDKPSSPVPPSLLALLEEWDSDQDTGFIERELLGEGGMAVVYLADQSLPQRQVALKRLRENDPQKAKQLFAEALLTGRLEHPNIIPVHAIHMHPKRGPEVVLKRVEGVSLTDAYNTDGQTDEGLRRLLPKLIQVCHALEYAHALHIIHRDIKTDNIMLGQYGEVYLLDWGLAIDKAASTGTNAGTVGTPHYLAPEMISGEPQMVDERTDVYLLGATLHYLLVGRPRHDAPTSLGAAVLAAESKSYVYGPDVFGELGALANRSCALKPSDRPQTVAAFRTAVEGCLAHWDAMRIVKRAQSDVDAVLDAEVSALSIDGVAKRFEAAALSLQMALSGWGECTEAKESLYRLRCAMTEHYLSVGDPHAARLVLNQFEVDESSNDPELVSLWRLVERANEQENRAHRIAVANDSALSSIGRRRASFGMLAVVASAIAWTGYQHLTQPVVRTAKEGLFIWLIGAISVMSVVVFNRKTLVKNDAGKRAMLVIMSAPALIAAIRLTVYINDLNPSLVFPIETFAVAHISAMAVETFPKGPYFAVFAIALGLVGLFVPTFAYLAFVTALLVCCTGFVWQWLMPSANRG